MVDYGHQTPPDQEASFATALLELFWLSNLLVYESFCFLALSGLAIFGSGLFESYVINNSAISKYGSAPTLQLIGAILILLNLTILFEHLEIVIVRPFINRLKSESSFLLSSTPGLLSVFGAFYFSWDVLQQFYQRYDILVHLPPPTVASPVECVSNLGLHFLGKLQECSLGLTYATINPVPLEDNVLWESKNTARFVLGLLYLTYFLYKRALKRVSISAFPFSDYALTHLKSNGILVVAVIASIGAFDVSNVKIIQRDWFIFLVLVLFVRIVELIPWYDIFGVEDVQGRDFQIIKAYSFWIHSLFFFLSMFGLSYIFFKVHLTGKDSLLYFYELAEPEPNNDLENDAKFGFATPAKIAAQKGLNQVQRSVNIDIITFRSLFTIMLISGTRCVEGYLKMEIV